MFFMKNFSLMAFELDVAQNLMVYSDNEEVNLERFNLISYFFYLLYQAGSSCGSCKDWI